MFFFVIIESCWLFWQEILLLVSSWSTKLFKFRFPNRFAELTACVFLNAGVPVLLFSQMVATPFIPFTILEKKCLAGVKYNVNICWAEENERFFFASGYGYSFT